jgi:hypothetical protein
MGISGLPFGVPRQKTIWMWPPWRAAEYTIWGESGGFPQVWAMVSRVSPELPVVCPSTKGALENDLTNWVVGLMQVRVNK